jgi:hypothetical protein
MRGGFASGLGSLRCSIMVHRENLRLNKLNNLSFEVSDCCKQLMESVRAAPITVENGLGGRHEVFAL